MPYFFIQFELSASSWGCELKYINAERYRRHREVSLFVRLWVEILVIAYMCLCLAVSLFVRLWVEIKSALRKQNPTKSASSWGCELKCNREICMRISRFVSLFVRLWIEIKWQDETVETVLRQPLRETVRWNFCKKCNRIYFFASFFIRLWVGRKQR